MEHVTAIETLAEQLKNMGEPPTKLSICTKIIYTLPEHLRGFITFWESLNDDEQPIPLLISKILNEESKNAMFKPQGHEESYHTSGYQGRDEGFLASSNKGQRGGYSAREGFSRGTGPPAAKKPRYDGPLCTFCHPKGFVATHPFADCRKHAHSVKRDPNHAPFSQPMKKDSIQVAFSQPTPESTFLNKPIIEHGLMNMEIGLPNGPNPITLEVLRANSVFYADSGATAHVTYEKNLLRNVIVVPKGSWVIQGFRDAQAEVQCYGDIDFEATVHGQCQLDFDRPGHRSGHGRVFLWREMRIRKEQGS